MDEIRVSLNQLPQGEFTLGSVSVPRSLLSEGCFQAMPSTSTNQSKEDTAQALVRVDIGISEGKFCSPVGPRIDMAGSMALPCFIDMHTHLDKGHIFPRAPNPDGTFLSALHTVRSDHAKWSAIDVKSRADFALRCAFAHGTRAVRTHVDSWPGQDEISWPVFVELRDSWRDRIELQMVSLIGCDAIDLKGQFVNTLDLVTESQGVLGLVTYPMEGLEELLVEFLHLAGQTGLDVDFHVDETLDANVETLRAICHAVSTTGFDNTVTVGHLCSLSVQDSSRAMDTLDKVKESGLHVVSLPMCNLYLQDRISNTTPGYRGVTLVHEMQARNIPVSFASDNTRDPFYAYGDLDMFEVMVQATRIAHLDHSHHEWIKSFNATPANTCGFRTAELTTGDPADLILFRARSWNELLSRPQSDRVVLRGGKTIDSQLPDYAELDHLMAVSNA